MPYVVDVGIVPKRSSRVISMLDLTIIVVGIECESEVGGMFYDPFSNKVAHSGQDGHIWGVIPKKGVIVCLSGSQEVLQLVLVSRPAGSVGTLMEKEVRFTHVAAAPGRQRRQPFAGRVGPKLELPYLNMVLTRETRIAEEKAVDFKVRRKPQAKVLALKKIGFVWWSDWLMSALLFLGSCGEGGEARGALHSRRAELSSARGEGGAAGPLCFHSRR